MACDIPGCVVVLRNETYCYTSLAILVVKTIQNNGFKQTSRL